MPLLGLVLNGTSSVLTARCPNWRAWAGASRHSRCSTQALGGVLSPVVFGRLGGVAGIPVLLAALLVLTLPLSWYAQKGLEGWCAWRAVVFQGARADRVISLRHRSFGA